MNSDPAMTNPHPDAAAGASRGAPIPPILESAKDLLPMDRAQLDDLERQMADLDKRARTFIRENPTTTVAIGVAAGFVLGRLLR